MFARVTLAVLMSLGSVASAQDQPARPETRRSDKDHKVREEFFKISHEVRDRTRGAQEMGYLLFQKAVREEIGLDDDRAKSIRDSHIELRAAADQIFEKFATGKLDKADLARELEKAFLAADVKFSQALGDDKSRDRLVGLFVQHRKASSVTNKLVAERVQLDEKDRLAILSQKEAIERELIEKHSSERPEDRWKSWEKIQRKVDEVVAQKLSPEQLERLEKLKGKEFVFEARPFGSGRPGPPRGESPQNRDCKEGDCKESSKDAESQEFNLATSQF